MSTESNSPSVPSSQEPTPSSPLVENNGGLSELERSEKVHKFVRIFAIVNIAALILWFLVGAGFPWFMYITFTTSLILCIIYGAQTKQYFFINLSIFININALLIFTFFATGGGYPWFIYPLLALSIAPGIQYIVIRYRHSRFFWFYIHLYIYVTINLICFFAWLIDSLHTSFPWFIYPWGGWGILLLIQYNHLVWQNKRTLLIYIAADISIMILVALRFAMSVFFFIIPLVLIIIYAIYWTIRKRRCQRNSQDPEAPVETTNINNSNNNNGQAFVYQPQHVVYYSNLPNSAQTAAENVYPVQLYPTFSYQGGEPLPYQASTVPFANVPYGRPISSPPVQTVQVSAPPPQTVQVSSPSVQATAPPPQIVQVSSPPPPSPIETSSPQPPQTVQVSPPPAPSVQVSPPSPVQTQPPPQSVQVSPQPQQQPQQPQQQYQPQYQPQYQQQYQYQPQYVPYQPYTIYVNPQQVAPQYELRDTRPQEEPRREQNEVQNTPTPGGPSYVINS